MVEGAADGLTPKSPADRVIERVTPEGLPTFYANNVSLGASIWDFTMDFGMILEATEDKLRLQDIARVTMSPQHAQRFSEILALHIKQYEDKFGRIPRSPEADEGGGEPSGT